MLECRTIDQVNLYQVIPVVSVAWHVTQTVNIVSKQMGETKGQFTPRTITIIIITRLY